MTITQADRDMVYSARPQDVVAAFSGVGLFSTIRVIKGLRLYADASGQGELFAEMDKLYHQCLLVGDDGEGASTLPSNKEKAKCSMSLRIADIHRDTLCDNVRNVKESRLWYTVDGIGNK
jgi:hypothetical protein